MNTKRFSEIHEADYARLVAGVVGKTSSYAVRREAVCRLKGAVQLMPPCSHQEGAMLVLDKIERSLSVFEDEIEDKTGQLARDFESLAAVIERCRCCVE